MSQYYFYRLLGDMLLQFHNILISIQLNIGRAKIPFLFKESWGEILGQPWEVGAAGSFASMLGNDDPWQCVVLCSAVSRGLVSP